MIKETLNVKNVLFQFWESLFAIPSLLLSCYIVGNLHDCSPQWTVVTMRLLSEQIEQIDGNRNNNKRVEERDDAEDKRNRVNQVYWDDEGNGMRTEIRLELKL